MTRAEQHIPERAICLKCWNSQVVSLHFPPAVSNGHITLIGSLLCVYVRDLNPPDTVSRNCGW